MNSVKPSALRIKRRHQFFLLFYLLLLAAIFIPVAEVAVRYAGVEPWDPQDVSIQVDPGGKFFQRHPTLGYSHIPGEYKVTLATGYSFRVTHLPNGLRVTHSLDTYPSHDQKPELWVFGCSMTYGWSLNDEGTYPWLLQEDLPRYEVVNFGVNGYGTIHSLIQFREALKEKTPEVAILAYSSLHDQRNTFSRVRRKRVAPYNKLGPLAQPYALLENGALRYYFADVEYREFPLMRVSALAHYIEILYDGLELKRYRSHEVSEALVAEMAGLAKEHGVKFILANILGGQTMLDWATDHGIPNVDIAVDLDSKEYTNLPHDEHPSAIACRHYADTLERFLKENIPQ